MNASLSEHYRRLPMSPTPERQQPSQRPDPGCLGIRQDLDAQLPQGRESGFDIPLSPDPLQRSTAGAAR
jgi:hypothetical protein